MNKITKNIDPRDLDNNKRIGIGLPFNKTNVFPVTYTTESQIKFNLINLLLTNKGERILNPEFGVDIYQELFEPIDSVSNNRLKTQIEDAINIFIPEVIVNEVNIEADEDNNSLYISVDYTYKLSKSQDTVSVSIQ